MNLEPTKVPATKPSKSVNTKEFSIGDTVW